MEEEGGGGGEGAEASSGAQVLVIEPEQWVPPTGEIQSADFGPGSTAQHGLPSALEQHDDAHGDRPATAGSRSSRPRTGGSARPGTGGTMYSEAGTLAAPSKALDAHSLRIRCMSWSPEWLATASDDSTTKVWSIKRQDGGQAWELAATLEHESPVWSCCFSVDGRVLVTGTKSSSITAWKVLPKGDFRKVEEEFKKTVDRKAKLEASMAEIKARVKQIGASLETARVFAAERLRTEQNKLRTQLGYMKKMLDGDAIPKYQELQMKLAELTEACSNPWTVIWRQKMAGHFAPIECIAISSNGSWLASCSSDSSAAVWDLKKTARSHVGPAGEPPPANPIMPNQKLIGHLDAVHCVSFSPASDTLCTASEDRTARVWRLTYEAEMSGKRRSSVTSELKPPAKWIEIAVLTEQGSQVTWCAFSPLRGKLLSTIGRDGVCCLYVTDVVDDDEEANEGSFSRSLSASSNFSLYEEQVDPSAVEPRRTGSSASASSRKSGGRRDDGGERTGGEGGEAAGEKSGEFSGSARRSASILKERGDGDRPSSRGGGGDTSRPGSRRGAGSRPGTGSKSAVRRVQIADDGGGEGVSEMDRNRVLVLAMQRYEQEWMRTTQGEEFVPWEDLPEERKNKLTDDEVDAYLKSDEYRSWIVWSKMAHDIDTVHMYPSSPPGTPLRPSTSGSSRRLGYTRGQEAPTGAGPTASLTLPPLRRSRNQPVRRSSMPGRGMSGVGAKGLGTGGEVGEVAGGGGGHLSGTGGVVHGGGGGVRPGSSGGVVSNGGGGHRGGISRGEGATTGGGGHPGMMKRMKDFGGTFKLKPNQSIPSIGDRLGSPSKEEEVEEEQALLLDTVLDVPLPRSAGKGPATDQWRPSSSAAVQHSYLDDSKPKAPWAIMRRFKAHERGLCMCGFNSDDRTLFTSSSDSNVRVWSAQDWSLGLVISPPPPSKGIAGADLGSGQQGGVFCMKLSTDGTWLGTTSWEGGAAIWDMSLWIAAPNKDNEKGTRRDSRFASPGYSQPVVKVQRKAGGGGSAGGAGADGTGLASGIRPLSRSRLSFLQVTKVYHEHALPFSTQCHSFQEPQVRLDGGRPVTAAAAIGGEGYAGMFQKQVTSEEIGADWNELFERIQLNSLTYRMPQVSPRFRDFLEEYQSQHSVESEASNEADNSLDASATGVSQQDSGAISSSSATNVNGRPFVIRARGVTAPERPPTGSRVANAITRGGMLEGKKRGGGKQGRSGRADVLIVGTPSPGGKIRPGTRAGSRHF